MGREIIITFVDYYKLDSNYTHAIVEDEPAVKNNSSTNLIAPANSININIETNIANKLNLDTNEDSDSEEDEDLNATATSAPNLIVNNETSSLTAPLKRRSYADFRPTFKPSAFHSPSSILSPHPQGQSFDFNLTIPDSNIVESELLQDSLVVTYGGDATTWKNTINHFSAPRKFGGSPPFRTISNTGSHSFSSYSVNKLVALNNQHSPRNKNYNSTSVTQSAMNLSYFKPVQISSSNLIERPSVSEKINSNDKPPRIPMSLKPFSSSPPAVPIELRKPGQFPHRPLPVSNKLPSSNIASSRSYSPIMKLDKSKAATAPRITKDSSSVNKILATTRPDLSFRQVFEKSKLLPCDSSWNRNSTILPPVTNHTRK